MSKRGGFSDRYGIKRENTEIQVKDFDSRTRTILFNMISNLYEKFYDNNAWSKKEETQSFLKHVMCSVYIQPRATCREYDYNYVFAQMKKTIMEDSYYAIMTLIEAIVQYWGRKRIHNESIFNYVNEIFKEEYIGYRFIGENIAPISDENEINAINEALSNKFSPVSNHIEKANSLLSDRKSPDYENSINESISAVEALCEIITGLKGKQATLGNMLKSLEDKGIIIHAALKEAFNKLYGYTSDANGIRHAGDIGGPSATFEEAKFMLVSCSAFINYLMACSADK